jgi:putative membrane protein
LAKNQGLYNGFLSAGLVWGLVGGGAPVEKFFLSCVVVAGLYGGATVGKQILLIQALPALIALVLVWAQ